MSNTYVRPTYTMQDKITKEEIDIMLEDYIEVDDIASVTRNTHIRYYTVIIENNKAKKVFRIGGELKFVSDDKVYVILANGDSKWSVQTKNTIFYRQLSIFEIKQEYDDILDEYEAELLELKKINRKLYKKLTGKTIEMSTNAKQVKDEKPNKQVKDGKSDKKPMSAKKRSGKVALSKSEMGYETEKNFRL
jgi:hypothetical protein